MLTTSTLNFITGDQGASQYANEGDEVEIHQLNVEPQCSFDLLGDSSSESEGDGLVSEVPPDYHDIVSESLVPVTLETEQLTTRASVYTGSNDVPSYIAEQSQ